MYIWIYSPEYKHQGSLITVYVFLRNYGFVNWIEKTLTRRNKVHVSINWVVNLIIKLSGCSFECIWCKLRIPWSIDLFCLYLIWITTIRAVDVSGIEWVHELVLLIWKHWLKFLCKGPKSGWTLRHSRSIRRSEGRSSDTQTFLYSVLHSLRYLFFYSND